MKTVLFITYHFPPTGGARTRRTVKFLKYLPRLSWTPVVLTAQVARHPSFDVSLMNELPTSIRIYRAPDCGYLLARVKGILGRREQTERDGCGRTPGEAVDGARSRGPASRFLGRYVGIPDAFILWAPSAIVQGVRSRKKEGIHVVYSTGPPFSNHLVAVALKKITSVRLIVDFRDAWVSNPVRRLKYPKIRVAIESWLERAVVKNADLVISTTQGIMQDFRSRYPTEVREKFTLIPNGYDREEFEERATVKRSCSRKLRVVHAGRLTWMRSPRHFFRALSLLVEERPHAKQEIELFFVGESHRFEDGKCIEDYIQDYELGDMVTLTGHISRMEAIQHIIDADILLLIVGQASGEEVRTYGVASKVFDYMVTGKPILALTDDGPVSRIVERAGIGAVVRPEDVRGMKQYLASSVEKYKNGGLDVHANMHEVRKYDIQVLTEKLARLLDGRQTSDDNRKPSG